MTEFKKLSEVEQVEAASDNATVLVEEGGEIKRVPKKEVGGAGGYVIQLKNSYMDENGIFCFEESYDDLYDVLIAGGSVWVDWTDAPDYAAPSPKSTSINDATNIGPQNTQVLLWQLTDVGLTLADIMGIMNGDPNIHFPNGSHNLERNEPDPS
jgi:hypothetical protein